MRTAVACWFSTAARKGKYPNLSVSSCMYSCLTPLPTRLGLALQSQSVRVTRCGCAYACMHVCKRQGIINDQYTRYMLPSRTPNPKGIALDSSSCDDAYAERSTQLLAAWSRQYRVHRPCNQPTSLGFAATIAISSALLCRYYFPCLKPLQVRPCRSMSPAGPKYKGNAGRQSGDERGKTRMNI